MSDKLRKVSRCVAVCAPFAREGAFVPVLCLVRIGKTGETPPKISVIDVVQAMTGKDARHAAQEVRTMCSHHPEVDQILVHFLFPGQGQRKTPVTSVRGIVEVVMLLPGTQAARVRRQAAELLCRWPPHPWATPLHPTPN